MEEPIEKNELEPETEAPSGEKLTNQDEPLIKQKKVKSKLFKKTHSFTSKLRSRSFDDIAETLTEKKSAPISKSVTIPQSPHLRVDKRSRLNSSELKSKDDLELEELEKWKELERERKLKAKRAFEMAKLRASQRVKAVVRSTKALTIPVTPDSRLNKRLGKKVSIRKSAEKVNQQKEPSKLTLTVPAPFHLASDERAKARGDFYFASSNSISTLGEETSEFFKDTRSHKVPDACKQVTVGKEFKFKSDVRCGLRLKEKPLSAEEREEALMEQMRRQQFKAKPVDKRVFEGSVSSLANQSRPTPRPLTVPKEFNLKTTQRIPLQKDVNVEIETPMVAFKARPMPDFSAISQSPRLTSVVPPRRLTIAISPKFHGGRRASSAPPSRQRPHHSEVEKQRAEELSSDLARNQPRTTSPRRLQLTEPVEFFFLSDRRGEAYKAHFEEKIRKELEEQQRAAKVLAKPVPDLRKSFSIKPSEKGLTEFDQFHLRSVELHSLSEQKFAEQLQKEEEMLKTEFKALALPKSTFVPVAIPETHEHAVTVPQPVVLQSEARAAKRREFDEEARQHSAEEARRRLEAEKLNADKENQEIRELRNKPVTEGGMKFVAAPVKTKDPYPTKPKAAIPLTEPKSPNLRAKLRPRAFHPNVQAIA